MTKELTMNKQHSVLLSLLEIILVLAVVLGIIVFVSNQMGRKTVEIQADKESESVAEEGPWQKRLEEVQAVKREQSALQEKALRDALGLEEPSQPDTVRRMDIQNMIQQLNSPPGHKSTPTSPPGYGANPD